MSTEDLIHVDLMVTMSHPGSMGHKEQLNPHIYVEDPVVFFNSFIEFLNNNAKKPEVEDNIQPLEIATEMPKKK